MKNNTVNLTKEKEERFLLRFLFFSHVYFLFFVFCFKGGYDRTQFLAIFGCGCYIVYITKPTSNNCQKQLQGFLKHHDCPCPGTTQDIVFPSMKTINQEASPSLDAPYSLRCFQHKLPVGAFIEAPPCDAFLTLTFVVTP